MFATRPVVWCLLAALLFGASTPASKALLDGFGPLTLAGLLYLGAALAVLPFSLSGGSAVRRRSPHNLGSLIGAVVFGGIVGPALLLYGLRLAPSASVSLWLNLETGATAVLALWFFQENLEWRDWLANLGVVVAGVVLAAPDGFGLAPAALLVAAAAVCWGLDNNWTATIDGFTPEQVTLAKGVVAGTFNLGLGLALGQPVAGVGLTVLALLVGGLAYGASIVLYIRGAQQLGATRSQMLFATAPFLGVAVAWVALGEPVALVQVIAMTLLIGSLTILFTGHHEHDHAHDSMVHTHLHCHDDGHHDHTHPDIDLPPGAWHTHEHVHQAIVHVHAHQPDLHHRHTHP
ncbi:MAG: DMT family transporter [Myxococcota bacterium]